MTLPRAVFRAPAIDACVFLIACGAGLGGGIGCSSYASLDECRSLLDRYVELIAREQDPKISESTLERQKELTREKARTDTSFADCPREVTQRELRCAMAAPNVDEFEKCLE